MRQYLIPGVGYHNCTSSTSYAIGSVYIDESCISISVSLTGVSTASGITAPGFAGSQIFSITGVGSSSALGILSITGTAAFAVAGLQSTTGITAPGFAGNQIFSITGVASASGITAPGFSGSQIFSITGVGSSGAVGTTSFSGTVAYALVGLQATSGVTGPGFTASAGATVAGVGVASATSAPSEAAGAVADVGNVTATLLLGTIAEACTAVILLTGTSASLTAGTPTVLGSAIVALASTVATSHTSEVLADSTAGSTDVDSNVTGVEAVSHLGALSLQAGANSMLPGIAAIAGRTAPSVSGSAVVSMPSTSLLLSLGTLGFTINASTQILGLSTSAATGITVEHAGAQAAPLGVASTLALGILHIGDIVALLLGVQATTHAEELAIQITINTLLAGALASGHVGTLTTHSGSTTAVQGVETGLVLGQVFVRASSFAFPVSAGSTATPGTLSIRGTAEFLLSSSHVDAFVGSVGTALDVAPRIQSVVATIEFEDVEISGSCEFVLPSIATGDVFITNVFPPVPPGMIVLRTVTYDPGTLVYHRTRGPGTVLRKFPPEVDALYGAALVQFDSGIKVSVSIQDLFVCPVQIDDSFRSMYDVAQ